MCFFWNRHWRLRCLVAPTDIPSISRSLQRECCHSPEYKPSNVGPAFTPFMGRRLIPPSTPARLPRAAGLFAYRVVPLTANPHPARRIPSRAVVTRRVHCNRCYIRQKSQSHSLSGRRPTRGNEQRNSQQRRDNVHLERHTCVPGCKVACRKHLANMANGIPKQED